MPGKKIIFIIFAFLIVGGGMVFIIGKGKARTVVYENKNVRLTEAEKIAVIDSDKDSLMDWEESLWKTDPQNPDTDGDGASDGEEVKNGRDPLRKGPNDKLDSETIAKKINEGSEAELSDTTKFSRELFVKLLAAKKAGENISESDYEYLIEKNVSREKEILEHKLYKPEDFKVFKGETADSIRAYGNSIASIMMLPSPEPLEHELEILIRVIDTENAAELDKLIPLVTQYNRIKTDLLNTKVPESAIPWHLEMTNSIVKKMHDIEGMRYIFSDPLRAIPAIGRYQEDADGFMKALRGYKDYFAIRQVTFAQEENGYTLWNNI